MVGIVDKVGIVNMEVLVGMDDMFSMVHNSRTDGPLEDRIISTEPC